jgi:hypothetical protein
VGKRLSMLSRKLLARRRYIRMALFWKPWKAGGENCQMPTIPVLIIRSESCPNYWNGVNVVHAAHFPATIRRKDPWCRGVSPAHVDLCSDCLRPPGPSAKSVQHRRSSHVFRVLELVLRTRSLYLEIHISMAELSRSQVWTSLSCVARIYFAPSSFHNSGI